MNIKNKIKNLFRPGETLSQKVVRSGFWVGFSKITERVLRFIRTIIVARLLSPSDFGLFGIACLAMDILETFTQTGTHSALIQKKDKIEEYLDTAWTVSFVRSFIVFFALFFFSPLVAKFFNNPGASGVTKVVAFTVLFGGLSNIGTVYFTKEIDFRKEFVLRISKIISNTVVTIIFAFILKNTWALVWGMVAGSLTGCIASYIIHPYRPRFYFEWSKARELLTFGKWIFASTILAFLVTQGDDILVGKILGTAALGFYTMAYAISNLSATEVTQLISQVTFPAYSKIQANISRLRTAYLKTLQITSFVSLPIAGLIFILGPEFTKLFLGEKWMPMVPALLVLTLWGAVRSIGATTGPVFSAVGRPDIGTKMQFVQLSLMALVIFPLTIKFGIYGTSLAVVFAAIITHSMRAYIVIKITGARVRDFFNMITPSLISTVGLILLIVILKNYHTPIQETIGFFIFLITSGVVAYFAIAYILTKFFRLDLFFNIKKIFVSI